jgi:hypothetical protein
MVKASKVTEEGIGLHKECRRVIETLCVTHSTRKIGLYRPKYYDLCRLFTHIIHIGRTYAVILSPGRAFISVTEKSLDFLQTQKTKKTKLFSPVILKGLKLWKDKA